MTVRFPERVREQLRGSTLGPALALFATLSTVFLFGEHRSYISRRGAIAAYGYRSTIARRWRRAMSEGRAASPSAGIVDSQSAKTTESGGSRGFDAGKKVKGRKRHIVTDTGGLLVAAPVRPADIQDRAGAPALPASLRYRFPWLRHIFADGAYAGPKLRAALEGKGRWRIEVVGRARGGRGFQALPRHWVVERTLAWLSRNRRLARDFEATVATARTWLFIGSVQILLRRLTCTEKTITWSEMDTQRHMTPPSTTRKQRRVGQTAERQTPRHIPKREKPRNSANNRYCDIDDPEPEG